MQKIRIAGLLLLAGMVIAPLAQGQKWENDPIHSGIHFMVRHVMTPMMGEFEDFKVDMVWDEEDMSKSRITATIDVNSVRMGSEKLEGHLKSEDFFDSEKYPEWKFVSEDISPGPGGFVAKGTLTVRGESKPYELPFQMTGTMDSPMGLKAGFMTQVLLKRLDFGMTYDEEAKLVGNDVQVSIYLEMNAVKK